MLNFGICPLERFLRVVLPTLADSFVSFPKSVCAIPCIDDQDVSQYPGVNSGLDVMVEGAWNPHDLAPLGVLWVFDLFVEVALEGWADGMGDAAREAEKEELEALPATGPGERDLPSGLWSPSIETRRRLRGLREAVVFAPGCCGFMAVEAAYA